MWHSERSWHRFSTHEGQVTGLLIDVVQQQWMVSACLVEIEVLAAPVKRKRRNRAFRHLRAQIQIRERVCRRIEVIRMYGRADRIGRHLAPAPTIDKSSAWMYQHGVKGWKGFRRSAGQSSALRHAARIDGQD